MNCKTQTHYVRSLAGHDKDEIFLAVECGDGKLHLINGKTRKLQNPKLKSIKHIEFLTRSNLQLAESIGGTAISDKEIRKMLAEYRCKSKL